MLIPRSPVNWREKLVEERVPYLSRSASRHAQYVLALLNRFHPEQFADLASETLRVCDTDSSGLEKAATVGPQLVNAVDHWLKQNNLNAPAFTYIMWSTVELWCQTGDTSLIGNTGIARTTPIQPTFDVTRQSPTAAKKTLQKHKEQFINEIEQNCDVAVRSAQDRSVDHYMWFIRFQVLNEPYEQIRAQGNWDRKTVREGVKNLAKIMGIELRKVRAGRRNKR